MFTKVSAGQNTAAPQPKTYLPIQNENTIILAILGLSVALALSLFGNLLLLFNNRALAVKDKTFVQLQGGYTIPVEEFDQHYREADVIRRTAATWMQLTFEWDNHIPDSDLKDKGYKVYGETVPTKAYLASYLMADGFRKEFLKLLGSTVVPAQVYSGQLQSVLRFYSISNPRQVAEGRWQVDIVATRIERGVGQEVREIPINRRITLQASVPIQPALGESEPVAWRRHVYELLNNGLIITDVIPLDLGNE